MARLFFGTGRGTTTGSTSLTLIIYHHSTPDSPALLHTIVQPTNTASTTLHSYNTNPPLFVSHYPQLYQHLNRIIPTVSSSLPRDPTAHTLTILPVPPTTSLPTTASIYLLATLYLYLTYPIQPPPPTWNEPINNRTEPSLHSFLHKLLIHLHCTDYTPHLWQSMTINTTSN